jgi:hypothetical protein
MNPEFQHQNLQQWSHTLKKIFPRGVPGYAEWVNLAGIASVLNSITLPSLNHMFIPDGGGQDLGYIYEHIEEGCLALQAQENSHAYYQVKPARLTFYCVDDDDEWAYFRLENLELDAVSDFDTHGQRQDLTEIVPEMYKDIDVWEQGYYYGENGDEVELPVSAKRVTRMLSPNAFVIFAKASLYNITSSTYDGRHNDMSDVSFSQYIRRCKKANKILNRGRTPALS